MYQIDFSPVVCYNLNTNRIKGEIIYMKTLKEKVKNCEEICGTHVSLAEPSVCEIIGYLGFDFIWVDMEHSFLTAKDVFIHANAARAAGTPVIVRIPQGDLTFIKRIMEMGVEGIVFPMIKSADEFEEMMSYTLYPPYGKRGFGPQRAIRYGLDDVDEYIGEGHINRFCRFIQIEHINAVNEIERIASNPYLDGIFFGPNDLSGSINQLGRVYDKDTTDLIKHTVKVLKAHGKSIGVSTGSTEPEVLEHWHSLGINMISSGADFEYLRVCASETLKRLRKVQSRSSDIN